MTFLAAMPKPVALTRHCLACWVSWCSTDELCWACGSKGQSGTLTNTGSSTETYRGVYLTARINAKVPA